MSVKSNKKNDASFVLFIQRKQRFSMTWTLVILFYYLLLPTLTSFFPSLMTYEVYLNISFAWVFASTQFLMTALICLIYYWKSKEFDQALEKIQKNSSHE